MTSFLKRLQTFLGLSSPTYKKVALLSEGNDFENDILLLKHLSDTDVSEPRADPVPRPRPHALLGQSTRYRFDLIQAHLVLSARDHYIIENAGLYADADALIINLDARDEEVIAMVNESLQLSLKGSFKSMSGTEDKKLVVPQLRKEIPWLVMVNFRDKPLDEQRARKLAGILNPDGFGVDWRLCPISTNSGEGIHDAASLLRKKLDNPGHSW